MESNAERVLLDTSLLVAAAVEAHPANQSARAYVAQLKPVSRDSWWSAVLLFRKYHGERNHESADVTKARGDSFESVKH
jgi:hypothetical protein